MTTDARKYKKRPPILNNKNAEAAKPEGKPYQRKLPEAPGAVLRIQPNGTRIWKLIQQGKPRTLGTMPVMTYAMAVDKALRILRGDDPDAEPVEEARPMTFGEFMDDHYEKHVNLNHSRPHETLAYIRRFNFEDKPLAEIKLADVETFRMGLQEKGRAASTINRVTTSLKAALQKAADWDLIETNPLAKLKMLKTDRRPVIRYLDDDESKRLTKAMTARDDELRAKRDSYNEWARQRGYEEKPPLGIYADRLTPMIMLALNTGLRRGELWNLKWADIDLKKKSLVVQGKGAKSGQTRHIPLNKAALTSLKTFRGNVVPMRNRAVFGHHEFKKSFASLLKRANIKDFRFHDLRHTFASRLVIAGVPLNTVRELMGHASLDMTLVYAHLAPENLRNAVELL